MYFHMVRRDADRRRQGGERRKKVFPLRLSQTGDVPPKDYSTIHDNPPPARRSVQGDETMEGREASGPTLYSATPVIGFVGLFFLQLNFKP